MFKKTKTPVTYQAVARANANGLLPGALLETPYGMGKVSHFVDYRQDADVFYFHVVILDPSAQEVDRPVESVTFAANRNEVFTVFTKM